MEIRDARNKEWFWLDNEYLNGYAKYLGISCTVVYLSLCRHSDNNTQTCFPSMKLMAQELGISTKTVERATKKLEEWRIILVQRSKKNDGTQSNNVYTLTSKKEWKEKPTDNKSVGQADRQIDDLPTDKNDESRQTPRPHNNTHINNTHLTILKDTAIIKYSEFENVKLKKEEHQKLIEKLGLVQTNSLIEELGGYLASTGKKYSSHYATLLNWARRKQNTVNFRKKEIIII